MYPSFNIDTPGEVETLIDDIYSPQLDNYRDVPVYTPFSLIENPIRRPVNVLVILDGFYNMVELMALSGGF